MRHSREIYIIASQTVTCVQSSWVAGENEDPSPVGLEGHLKVCLSNTIPSNTDFYYWFTEYTLSNKSLPTYFLAQSRHSKMFARLNEMAGGAGGMAEIIKKQQILSQNSPLDLWFTTLAVH